MARPALSASRTTAILNLLTAYPDRAFKMSEIVQATKINIASCHAVLSVLTKSGYLARTPDRTFVLGPALVPLGQVAAIAHPLIGRAQTAAKELFQKVHVPVVLSTLVDDEILVLSVMADYGGRRVTIRAGQRQPAVAPLGSTLIAWCSEEMIEAWMDRAGVTDEALRESWRVSLGVVRKRGYQVLLSEPHFTSYGQLISELAAAKRPQNESEVTLDFVQSHQTRFTQIEEIVPDAIYDVVSICAPIVTAGVEANMSLCLGGFPDKLSGAQTKKCIEELVRACMWVVRDHRAL